MGIQALTGTSGTGKSAPVATFLLELATFIVTKTLRAKKNGKRLGRRERWSMVELLRPLLHYGTVSTVDRKISH